MIMPTVARSLHYYPAANDHFAAGLPEGEPLAAILAGVVAPDQVNLCVFSFTGEPQLRRNVKLVQEGEEKPEGQSYAAWMPYQVGQAKAAIAADLKLVTVGTGGASGSAGAEQGSTHAIAFMSAGAPPISDPGHNLAPPAPASSLEVTEASSAAVAVAPRVTLADIKAAIDQRYDFRAAEAAGFQPGAVPPLDILSVCVLVMKNGFTVIGKAAPASPANFNRELGKQYAYEDAVRQLWPLMGYALRDRLAAAAAA